MTLPSCLPFPARRNYPPSCLPAPSCRRRRIFSHLVPPVQLSTSSSRHLLPSSRPSSCLYQLQQASSPISSRPSNCLPAPGSSRHLLPSLPARPAVYQLQAPGGIFSHLFPPVQLSTSSRLQEASSPISFRRPADYQYRGLIRRSLRPSPISISAISNFTYSLYVLLSLADHPIPSKGWVFLLF